MASSYTDNLTADGTSTFALRSGTSLGFEVTGDFGGGTLSIQTNAGVEIDSLSDDAAKAIDYLPTDNLKFVLSGSSSPDIDITVTESK